MSREEEQFFDEEDTYRVTLPALARLVHHDDPSPSSPHPSLSLTLSSSSDDNGWRDGPEGTTGCLMRTMDSEAAASPRKQERTRIHHSPFDSPVSSHLRRYTSELYPSDGLPLDAGARIFCLRDVVDPERRAALASGAVQAAIARNESQRATQLNEGSEGYVAASEHSGMGQALYDSQMSHLLSSAEGDTRDSVVPAMKGAERMPCPPGGSGLASGARVASRSFRQTTAQLRQQERALNADDPVERVEVRARGEPLTPRGQRQPALLFSPVPARYV